MPKLKPRKRFVPRHFRFEGSMVWTRIAHRHAVPYIMMWARVFAAVNGRRIQLQIATPERERDADRA